MSDDRSDREKRADKMRQAREQLRNEKHKDVYGRESLDPEYYKKREEREDKKSDDEIADFLSDLGIDPDILHAATLGEDLPDDLTEIDKQALREFNDVRGRGDRATKKYLGKSGNQKKIQKASKNLEKSKKKSCAVVLLALIGVATALGYGVFEGASAIISALS